jgi:hypothetical protein
MRRWKRLSSWHCPSLPCGQSLYKVSDISVVWVEADVYESELAAIKGWGCR